MNLQNINASASPEVQMNENFEALDWASVYAKDPILTSALTWSYLGGRWGGFAITTGTIALTNNADNYLVVAKATGVITKAVGSEWTDPNYVRAYKVTTAAGLVTVIEDHRAGPLGVFASVEPLTVLGFALSDETTNLSAGNSKLTVRMPFAFNLVGLPRSSLSTVSSSGLVTVDINASAVSILSTKLSIDQGEKTSTTAVTPAVVSDAALADDEEITFDIDAAGTGAKGLKVYLLGRRA